MSERVLASSGSTASRTRPATDLSGGSSSASRWRARSLCEPPLLLLDEPLSNLDAKLRTRCASSSSGCSATLGVTTVYVTHDQEEALAMSSVVAVMSEGRIEQTGEPREVYEQPASRFVADFIGDANLIDGVVEERRNGACVVRTADGLAASADGGRHAGRNARRHGRRAEQFRLGSHRSPAGPNSWPGVVRMPVFRGDSVDHEVSVGDCGFRIRTEPGLAAAPGDRSRSLFLSMPVVFPPRLTRPRRRASLPAGRSRVGPRRSGRRRPPRRPPRAAGLLTPPARRGLRRRPQR